MQFGNCPSVVVGCGRSTKSLSTPELGWSAHAALHHAAVGERERAVEMILNNTPLAHGERSASDSIAGSSRSLNVLNSRTPILKHRISNPLERKTESPPPSQIPACNTWQLYWFLIVMCESWLSTGTLYLNVGNFRMFDVWKRRKKKEKKPAFAHASQLFEMLNILKRRTFDVCIIVKHTVKKWRP